MEIPLTKPFFDKTEIKAVNNVLRSGWVTQGPRVAEFENAICDYTGAKYGVAVTSATTALFLSLYLLDIRSGDEVVVPSFSFIATANVIMHVGAKPVFVDIDPQTYNLDADAVEKLITRKTKAIIPVDQIGLPYDHDKIHAIAKKYKLYVIEDAACALGSIYKGKMIGSFGDLVCFSFHPRKCITTGEGGIILTSKKQYADKLRMLRHHGMSVSDVARHKSKKIIKESYPFVGFNFRMSDIQAAVGVEQMKKLPKILKKRTEIAERYTNLLSKSEFIIPPYIPEGYVHNYQSYMVRLSPDAPLKRDQLMQKLREEKIATRNGVMAAHEEVAYASRFGKISLPNTETATQETIILPLYYQMTKNEQDYVINRVNFHVNNNS